jgi:uncharacterized membrane protein YphA (DoxX/SURF4 family)
VLRLCLGCHFLYEGVWKIEHADEFSAEPFLSQAKGPVSAFFYAMIPDQYGRQRLEIGKVKNETDELVEGVDCSPIVLRWGEIRQNLVAYLNPGPAAGEEAKKTYDKFKADSEATLKKAGQSLQNYFTDKETVEAIKTYFNSLDRFEKESERDQNAPFQKERRWNRMMELRGEAKVWVDEIENRERVFVGELREQMPDEYRVKITTLPGGWKPWKWSQMQFINFTVTFGITAIGLCLLSGLFTRLAALGGAAFMCFVVLTQPAWPGIYPPDLPQLGHALIINKDFLEMVALLVIASSPAGRWGGLDHFVHYLIVEPFLSKRMKR